MTDRTKNIIKKFALRDPGSHQQAFDEIKGLDNLTPAEKQELSSGLASLFYRDQTSKDVMEKEIDQVEKLLGSFGGDVVEILLGHLTEADAETAEHFANALGIIGEPAIEPVRRELKAFENDQHAVTNLLLALGSFSGKDAIAVAPTIFEYAGSGNTQVKASALNCIGRTATHVDADSVGDSEKTKMFDTCFGALADPKALVRLHAVRALGEMLQSSYMNQEQVDKTHKAYKAVLGMDDFEWDIAYIVRHEAEHYMHLCRSHGKGGNPVSTSRYIQDFRVISKKELCPNTFHFRINAPLLAAKIKAGQFIIMRPNDHSERIPLSICGWDRDEGYIELIIMAAGRTSTEAVRKEVGDCFQDVVGPLGQRSHVVKHEGTCVVLGGGYGTGAIIPTARDLKEQGNRVIGVVGAREKSLLIMVDELREVCDEVYTTTNDGSDGIEGFVTHALEKIMSEETVSMTLSVGPVPMMIAVTNMVKEHGIEGWVSLNAIMVDGTGMCGACRVSVDGKTKFACFHGPDFKGAEVDFNELIKRQRMFVDKEKIAFEALKD